MERLGAFPPQKPGSAAHPPIVTLTPAVGVVVSVGPVGPEPPLPSPPPPQAVTVTANESVAIRSSNRFIIGAYGRVAVKVPDAPLEQFAAAGCDQVPDIWAPAIDPVKL